MRSGGYTLHHSLTAEAAATVKQAVSLARRRGHAQVTPLHVASAMLASPAALLKRACLQSHSHPLQCKALDLCFNVALNRLPTSASTPLLGPLSHLPSLSNALVAAFKRAQAHQRRGSIENHQHQQQTILALKVEIEQLVISILDDPSVSRVMREAGFSSTQVKSNVEQAISTDKCSPQAPTTITQPTTTASSHQTNLSRLQNNDVSTVLEAMANKKTKNTVILGECAATNEHLVKRVIEKFDKKDVPYEMKSVQFISVPLFTLRNISKEEFELKLGELRSLVKSYVGRGVVLYLGDLDWVSEFWSKHGEQRSMLYSPIEFMIMELSRLVSGAEENYYKRIWLMGIASFNTYAKCKSGRPSLETLWNLHPLTLGGLALGLSLDSMHDDNQVKKEAVVDDLGIKKNLVCCFDCEENFRKEAQDVMSLEREFAPTSRLPSWLQQYKDENKKHQFEESDNIKDLCKKWNSICSSVHKKPHFLEKVLELSSSSSPSSSNSLSSDQNKSKILLKWPGIFDHDDVSKPSLALAKPELLSNPNSSPNSASSSEASEDMKLLDSDNLEIVTAALEKKVPWQKDIVPDIVTTILKCRSGNMRRERRDSWLLFLGSDQNGKEIMAKELAKIVFGSDDDFFGMGISNFSSVTRSDSTEEVVSKKRCRDEKGGSVYDRFLEAVRDNPSRVFYVEDVDQLDRRCRKEFERAMENGSVSVGDDGEVLLLKDAIVIFSCESRDGFAAVEHGRKKKGEDDDEEKPCGPLDLNVATDEVCGIGMLELVDMQVVFRIASLVN